MVEIDDAGGGCFIGPEVLVIHRVESGEYWYYYIPPQVNERIQYATKLLKKAFRELKMASSEPVKLCRGEIFDKFQIYLTEQGFQVIREKVSDETNRLAETEFIEILYSYGFPRNLCLEGRNYQDFYTWVGCWYYSQPQKMVGQYRKRRLKVPYWTRKVARKYPNLIRILLEEQAI